jgi:hypothetical protein
MGNQGSGGVSRKRSNFYYFDQLPAELRHALAHSAVDWDAKWFLDRWNGGRWSIPALIKEIKESDAKFCAKPVAYRAPGNFGWKKHKTAYADKATRAPILYPEGM